MLMFIDTEFSDFTFQKLISLGVLSECGQHKFYAELPVNPEDCSPFVRETVLPLLGKIPGAACANKDELTQRLNSWLQQFAADKIYICWDYEGDWILFCSVVGKSAPQNIRGCNVRDKIDAQKLHDYFQHSGNPVHHALHDAEGNRLAADHAAIRRALLSAPMMARPLIGYHR